MEWAEPTATYLLVEGARRRGWRSCAHVEGNTRWLEGTNSASAGRGGKGERGTEDFTLNLQTVKNGCHIFFFDYRKHIPSPSKFSCFHLQFFLLT